MKKLLKRSITAIIYVLLLVGSVYYGLFTAALFFLLVGIISAFEFYKLSFKTGASPQSFVGIISGIILMLVLYPDCFESYRVSFLGFIIIPFLFIIIREVYSSKPTPILNISTTLSGVVYVFLPLILLLYTSFLFNEHYGFQYILIFMFTVWANDTGAYFTGMSIGKHKLFERVSPNKTWEGTFGGVLLAIITACLSSFYFESQLSIYEWGIAGLIIAVFSVFGDLSISAFKRAAVVKDTGNILPGHGGFLDRFDSVFIAAPAYYFYLLVLKTFIH